MMRRVLFILLAMAGLVHAQSYDVVVYGGTSAGVIAAAQAARLGKKTLLIAQAGHVGGMTSGGLGETDIGQVNTVAGMSREFYERIYAYYQRPEVWTRESRADFIARRKGGIAEKDKLQWVFEPHVAELVFRRMLTDAGVTLVENERIDLHHGVSRQGTRITSLRTESGHEYAGRVFIDCSYEGDLMASAGIKYVVGREDNSVYGETLNGVRSTSTKPLTISPYRVAGEPSSGLLPGIEPAPSGTDGSGDKRVQAYTFRVCLTDMPANRLPITKPDHYDPMLYEALVRSIAKKPTQRPGASLFKLSAMPNGKTDSNNQGSFSTDFVGGSYDWAGADYVTRDAIWQKHKDYVQGLLWFLGNDPRLPVELREDVNKWGLPKDEFINTGGWPYQLYVREARRMVGEYVVTEADAMQKRVVDDPVAYASYLLDSHWISRFDAGDKIGVEGVYYAKMPSPMPISYRALLPRQGECTNVLVPVCLSASHVAYGTIRMEPVYMMLGQASAWAASIAIDGGLNVQDVPYARLQALMTQNRLLVTPPASQTSSTQKSGQ